MPGLELPSQYQKIHHAGREGGRRERRKIMYNTNKVSPPLHSQPIFSKGAQSRGVVSRGVGKGICTGEESGYKMHSGKWKQKPSSAYLSLGEAHALATSAVGSCTGASLHPAGLASLCLRSWGRTLAGTALLGKRRAERKGALPASTGLRGQAFACKQH